jgi:hypothetical protein
MNQHSDDQRRLLRSPNGPSQRRFTVHHFSRNVLFHEPRTMSHAQKGSDCFLPFSKKGSGGRSVFCHVLYFSLAQKTSFSLFQEPHNPACHFLFGCVTGPCFIFAFGTRSSYYIERQREILSLLFSFALFFEFVFLVLLFLSLFTHIECAWYSSHLDENEIHGRQQ